MFEAFFESCQLLLIRLHQTQTQNEMARLNPDPCDMIDTGPVLPPATL